MRHRFAFDAGGLLQWKMHSVDGIDVSFCTGKTAGCASRCGGSAIAEAKLLRRFGTYCNFLRTHCKWKLFLVA